MAENNFKGTVESLFRGMEGFITGKTVVGDAMKFDDGTIILPLVDVSFGVAAGAFSEKEKKDNGYDRKARALGKESILHQS